LRAFDRIPIVLVGTRPDAMLDAFIIQRIRDEEDVRRRHPSRRPFLEVPLPERERPERTDEQEAPSSERGVTIIEPDEDQV